MTSKTITLAEYLFARIRQLGCKSLHGLPGDFNLLALEYVEPSGLHWVGNCNELNAGYAADAYARVTGLGAIMTTFGIGKLSAVNAIAGAFAERSPVVHIANLTDPDKAPAEIDRVLRVCSVDSRPVYIQLPTDIVTKPVHAQLLEKAMDVTPSPSAEEAENSALQQIFERLYSAERPTVLVDTGVQRHEMIEQTEALVRKLNIPTLTTPTGKSTVDESLPNFVGCYSGPVSHPDVKAAIEKSDLIITIGEVLSDLNTGGFSYVFLRDKVVAIACEHCDLGYARIKKTWKIQSRVEFEKLLQDDDFASGRGLQSVVVHMPKLDAPQALKDFGSNAAKRAS